MNNVIDQLNLFRPASRKPTSKGDITDQTARAIIRAEGEQRNAKTTRLREARLQSEKALAETRSDAGHSPLRGRAKAKQVKAG